MINGVVLSVFKGNSVWCPFDLATITYSAAISTVKNGRDDKHFSVFPYLDFTKICTRSQTLIAGVSKL